MESNQPSPPSAEATVAFEEQLTELILSAFGRGAAIEDTWTIDGPASAAPDWQVTVEKVPPEPEELKYNPQFLEE